LHDLKLTLDNSFVKHYVGLTITALIYRIKVGRVGTTSG